MLNSDVYCIIGGTGFLGQHLLPQLIKQQPSQIRVLTRKVNNTTQDNTAICYVQGDLLTIDSIENFILPNAIVINLAYLQQATAEANIRAVENLAKICKQKQVKKLLHVSTAVVVGATAMPIITEDTLCEPLSDYEKNKLAIEQMLIATLNNVVPLVLLRPTAIFGKGGQNVVKLIEDLQRNSKILRWLKLSLYRDRNLNLVAVDNVVAAIVFLAELPATKQVEAFIISDDEFEKNNYSAIMHIASEVLHQTQFMPLPFINYLLPPLLKWRRRSQWNPKRIYSSTKLERYGFHKPVSFNQAIYDYIVALGASRGSKI